MRREVGVTRLYVEEAAAAMTPQRLPDALYSLALDSFIMVCADTLLLDPASRTVWLARRRARPVRGAWWFIGGRMQPGESELAAAARCVRRETSLVVAPERFSFLGLHRYFFRDRQQDPQDRPCDSLCFTFALPVTEAEIAAAAARLDPAEYEVEDGLRRFDRAALQDPDVPLAIRDAFDAAFP